MREKGNLETFKACQPSNGFCQPGNLSLHASQQLVDVFGLGGENSEKIKASKWLIFYLKSDIYMYI